MRRKAEQRLATCLTQLAEHPYAVNIRKLKGLHHWRIFADKRVVDFWPMSGRYVGITNSALNGKADDLTDVLSRISREA